MTTIETDNLADALRDASLRQIRERTEGYDDPLDAAVLRAALLVIERRIAGSPSDLEAHDLHKNLKRYLGHVLIGPDLSCGCPGLPMADVPTD